MGIVNTAYGQVQLLATDVQLLAADGIDVNPQAPPGSEKFLTLVSWVAWGACLAAVAALMIAGGKFGFDRHQGTADSESAAKVAKTCIGCVIIAIAGGLVGALTA
ncbi:hypothetical protein QBL07_024160 (plasmid) [Gordonia rubripertincta]|uniref:Integral membrane protein n=2 Tax=Gordonia rubripertincta TaxID=36822 RepID=A0AAW6RCE8_GORRU|nr:MULTISPECIES: hypothetical protein [Gordonia]MDG6783104.1 hypothetical protein [Gordonia rubripertincta]NKY65395.1 hypothetical protein [Gordonia rubripertincta]GAB86857.1 hypothetical protein GORBP_083_00070 [Gordonia rubripertincta NBRC 101908]